MTIKKLILISCTNILIAGCLPQKVVTLGKSPHTILSVHPKIMVVGIIKVENDSMRTEIEDGMVKNLTELGYNAVSALREFGPKGLSDLSQEGTYIRLCNNGIDAVMTIALIDKFKQKKYRSGKIPAGSSYYYYNRILNYRKIQADLSESRFTLHRRHIWESILFDLGTLEPLGVVQTKPFAPGEENEASYISLILDKMKKGKILSKQNSPPPKAF